MTPNRPGRNCRRKRRRLEDHGRLDQLLAHAARAGPARRDHPADRGQLRYRARDARLAHAKGADIILAARNPDRLHRAGLELGASIAAFDATDFDRLGQFFDALPPPIDHLLVTGSVV